jgi:hypothetical protein
MRTGEQASPLQVPCMEILLKYGCEKYSARNAWKTCTLIEEKY